MSTKHALVPNAGAEERTAAQILKQYGCSPIPFMGADGLYDRHVHFDNVVIEGTIAEYASQIWRLEPCLVA